MNQPSVSIIMPVYNTEKYVAEAINSVLAQSLMDWELLIINDGSTDNSMHIIQELAAMEGRIKLVNQANAGLSAARNAGLSIAQGKYIYFLDSDDAIIPDTLEACFMQCESLSLDFVFFDADTNYESEESKLVHSLTYTRQHYPANKVDDGIHTARTLLLSDEYLVSACLLFTARQFIEEHQLSFYVDIVHEDELYTTQLFLHASRCMYISRPFFIRRLRANSTMTSPVRQHNINSYFIVATELKQLAEADHKYGDVIDIYLKKTLNAVLWKAHSLSFKERISIFWRSLIDWSSYIRMRTWFILLFKKYVPKK